VERRGHGGRRDGRERGRREGRIMRNAGGLVKTGWRRRWS
jgi:hypothetical protein